MSLAMISSCSMSFAAPVAASMTGLARSSTLVMGFGPSEKDLSNDPPIKEVLAIAKVEQQARLARLAMATVGGATFAKTLPVRTLTNARALALASRVQVRLIMCVVPCVIPQGAGPFGFFDPFGCADVSGEEVMLYREAELAHGRVAMMAAVGFLVQEAFHPIFPAVNGVAARQLDQVLSTEEGWLGGSILLMAIFFSEIWRARVGWMDPKVAPQTLRPGYMPGDLGFDPLNLKPANEVEYLTMQNKELNNGRTRLSRSNYTARPAARPLASGRTSPRPLARAHSVVRRARIACLLGAHALLACPAMCHCAHNQCFRSATDFSPCRSRHDRGRRHVRPGGGYEHPDPRVMRGSNTLLLPLEIHDEHEGKQRRAVTAEGKFI